MHTGIGRIAELILEDESRYAHISCPEALVPGPGQYVLASHHSDSYLPVSIFHTDLAPQGFMGPAPQSWKPGDVLRLRGPLGRGFSLPLSARRVGLLAFDGPPSYLRGLIRPSLRQGASVVLLCDSSADHLPDEVEVLPVSALGEIVQWADFIALDVTREQLKELKETLGKWSTRSRSPLAATQVLVRTPMPCGGVADCGICALTTGTEWKMICKDGPVFDWREI